jgi:hypothetical protein
LARHPSRLHGEGASVLGRHIHHYARPPASGALQCGKSLSSQNEKIGGAWGCGWQLTETGQQYLEIEQVRLNDRLDIEFLVSNAAEDALVPALLLQAIVENAVRHGIAPQEGDGRLSVHAHVRGSRVHLIVADNGVGTSNRQTDVRQHRGLGLANTIERLRAVYGEDQHLGIGWPEQGGCVVEMEFPYQSVAAARESEERQCVS